MTAKISLLNGIFSFITDFLTGIFAFFPQMIYFIYTCAASVLDFLQYLVRKLAGLDTYYVNGEAQTGDIVLSFIKGVLGIDGSGGASEYSVLSTVFWSMILFALLTLVLSTIIKMIMTHYDYDSSKSNPMTIIRSSIKSIFSMVLVPIVTVFGITISNALLKILDQISSGTASTTISTVYENSPIDVKSVFQSGEDSWGNTAYTSYDFFGFSAYNLVSGSGAYTNSTTISGQLFLTSVTEANRVRHETFTATQNGNDDQWDNLGIFKSELSNSELRREDVAYMIDYAFANNLVLKSKRTASVLAGAESLVLTSSFSYLQSAVWYLGTIQFGSFSKFNVGLVWYYYNLWSFNFLIGFAGIAVALTLLLNIIFGLISRLIYVLALFLVYPMLLGIEPLDGGNAFSNWKSEFMSNILMAYGAIVGMNLAFLVLPALQSISFFNFFVADALLNMIIVIACLLTVKSIIGMLSQLVGGKDAHSEGASVKDEVKKNSLAAADKVVKVASIGVQPAKLAGKAMASKKAGNKKTKDELVGKAVGKMGEQEQDKKGEGEEKESPEEEQTDQTPQNDEEQNQENEEQTQDTENNDEEKPEEKEKTAQEVEDDAVNSLAELGSKFKSLLGKDIKNNEFGNDTQLALEVNKWYDERIKELKELRQREKGSKLNDEELNQIENQAKQEGVEKFLRQHSSMDALAQNVKSARKAETRVGRAKKKIKKGVAEALDRPIVQITAESLKAIGSFAGLSGLAKGLAEQGTIDAGLKVIRDFAQALNLTTSKIPKTKAEKEAEEKQEKADEAVNIGKASSYSQAVMQQMTQLVHLVGEWNKDERDARTESENVKKQAKEQAEKKKRASNQNKGGRK